MPKEKAYRLDNGLSYAAEEIRGLSPALRMSVLEDVYRRANIRQYPEAENFKRSLETVYVDPVSHRRYSIQDLENEPDVEKQIEIVRAIRARANEARTPASSALNDFTDMAYRDAMGRGWTLDQIQALSEQDPTQRRQKRDIMRDIVARAGASMAPRIEAIDRYARQLEVEYPPMSASSASEITAMNLEERKAAFAQVYNLAQKPEFRIDPENVQLLGRYLTDVGRKFDERNFKNPPRFEIHTISGGTAERPSGGSLADYISPTSSDRKDRMRSALDGSLYADSEGLYIKGQYPVDFLKWAGTSPLAPAGYKRMVNRPNFEDRRIWTDAHILAKKGSPEARFLTHAFPRLMREYSDYLLNQQRESFYRELWGITPPTAALEAVQREYAQRASYAEVAMPSDAVNRAGRAAYGRPLPRDEIRSLGNRYFSPLQTENLDAMLGDLYPSQEAAPGIPTTDMFAGFFVPKPTTPPRDIVENPASPSEGRFIRRGLPSRGLSPREY